MQTILTIILGGISGYLIIQGVSTTDCLTGLIGGALLLLLFLIAASSAQLRRSIIRASLPVYEPKTPPNLLLNWKPNQRLFLLRDLE